MAQTYIYNGSHDNIPPTASAGFLFLRDIMPIIDSLDPDHSSLKKYLTPDVKFIFNGSSPTSVEKVLETLRMRSTKLSKYVHEGDIAWDIVKEDGTRTVMYESTCIVAFKEDPEGVEARVREFSVNELVLGDDGSWRAVELRVFMDPSPTDKDKQLPEERPEGN
jgi:hypothetical protein